MRSSDIIGVIPYRPSRQSRRQSQGVRASRNGHPGGRKSRGGSLLWGLDSPSPSTLLQTFQALPNPHDSPLALGSPTRSAGVVPVARFRAVTVTPESSAVASAAHPDGAFLAARTPWDCQRDCLLVQ